MNRAIMVVFLALNMFEFSHLSLAESTSMDVPLIELPLNYELAKMYGEKMTLDQLLEFKNKMLRAIDKYPTGSEEDYRLLHHYPYIIAAGLYNKDVKFAREALNEIKNNVLLFYQKRGDRKWKEEDQEDQLLHRKFELLSKFTADLLVSGFLENDPVFCLSLIKDNMDIPFVLIRIILAKNLARLYNAENVSPELKKETESIFTRFIEVEKSALESTTDQDDFIRSRSFSSSILKVLNDKKEESSGNGGFGSE